MIITTAAAEPPYTSTNGNGERSGSSHDYLFVVGFFFTVLLLFTITYCFAYFCKRSRSPPPHGIAFGITTNDNPYDVRHLIRSSRGLDDDVLETFPVFVYSDITIPHKGYAATASSSSGCSICLVDYKPPDILRSLPECGHLFHVSCIDTWLKAHPTCPVCRNSPFAGMVPVSINLTNLIT